jgi:hypothetical protein
MSRIVSAVALLALAFAPAVVAQEDRDAAFKAGLDARQDKKWQDAAAQMRRAIQSNPKEDPRKVTRGIGRLLGGGTEYLPFYFLGEALYYLGDCAEAVEAWSTSERQGVVKTRPEYFGTLQKGYAACEAKGVLAPAPYERLLARTRQQVTDATNQAGAISARGQQHLALWRADASLREQYDKASAELQNAQARLASATRTRSEREFNEAAAAADRAKSILGTLEGQLDAAITLQSSVSGLAGEVEQALQQAQDLDRAIDGEKAFLTPTLAGVRQGANEALARGRSQLAAGQRGSNVAALNEARTLALDASTKFKSVLDEVAKQKRALLDARLKEALGAAQGEVSFVEGAFATLEARLTAKPADATPEMLAQRDALQKQFAAVQRRLENARRGSNVAGIQQATGLATEVRAQLDTIIGRFGPMTIIDRGVRQELAEGARLFFAGEYQQALAVLDPAALTDVPLQLHVHLFRAAALYALYVRSGERDQAQRDQAQAEVEKCKQISPGFVPAARAFAPRFISFFQNGIPAAPPAAVPPS